MKKYNHKSAERRWQKKWETQKAFKAADKSAKPKFYSLIEFPYPSGDGLHVGHVRSYTALDVLSRKKRLEGMNVLYPIGWDAFGLPAENYAIKTGKPPAKIVAANIRIFKKQIKKLGISFDWSREVNTTDPAYYKWTQWIFLQLFKAGLAYKKKMPINWCPSCKIGLANEEVVDEKCERCGAPAEKKELEQWMLRITAYADRLIEDLKTVDYLEKIKTQQVNWIGKSEGAEIEFGIKNNESRIKVFTTRPDTIFGATFLVLAPEHELVNLISTPDRHKAIHEYQEQARQKSDSRHVDVEKEKTGVFTGAYAINPATKKEIPIWIADYVGMDYGTGAIMAVPAHDERDFAFAKKFDLPIVTVIEPKFVAARSETAIKPELPFVKREAVCAIVRNPKDNTYLCNSWKKFKMHGLFTGGIETGEDPVETARREVEEETGYKHLKHVRTSGTKINTYFYHRVKQQNRHAHFTFVFFDLIDDERAPVKPEEAEQLEIVWKKRDELKDFFTVYEGNFILNILDNDNYLYADHGLLINSGNFTGRDSDSVKKDITEFIGGKLTTNYHLRDWVFSRQHYWGEPIPLVYCDNCAHGAAPKNLNGVGVLLQTEEGKFLLQERDNRAKRNPNMIAPFGGAMEKGENTEDAVVREIKEELSLELLKEQLQFIGYFESRYEPGTYLAMFRADIVKSGKITVSEGKGIVEISKEDALKHPKVTGFTKQVLRALDTNNADRGWIPLSEADLPLKLPKVKKYQPTGTGESPLAAIEKWVNVKCPRCGGKAKRETDTMPNWAGSSWYFLRYIDPKNKKSLADFKKLKYWLPVDLYNGGMEHVTLHLLYSRFWHKFLYDIGAVPTLEPYQKRIAHGMILAADGQKMSKSRGNVINPDEIVKEYGADVLRLYEMFIGPYDQVATWDLNGVRGIRRFVDRIYNFENWKKEDDAAVLTLLHKTIKKVSEDIDSRNFNTAVSAMMIFVNKICELGCTKDTFKNFLIMICPFAPHLAEEMWCDFGNKKSILKQKWVKYDSDLIKDEQKEIVVQVNGKVRDKLFVAADISEADITALALKSEYVQKFLEGKQPKKIIYVKGRLVSIVI